MKEVAGTSYVLCPCSHHGSTLIKCSFTCVIFPAIPPQGIIPARTPCSAFRPVRMRRSIGVTDYKISQDWGRLLQSTHVRMDWISVFYFFALQDLSNILNAFTSFQMKRELKIIIGNTFSMYFDHKMSFPDTTFVMLLTQGLGSFLGCAYILSHDGTGKKSFISILILGWTMSKMSTPMV